jgi:hypothetical protein
MVSQWKTARRSRTTPLRGVVAYLYDARMMRVACAWHARSMRAVTMPGIDLV